MSNDSTTKHRSKRKDVGAYSLFSAAVRPSGLIIYSGMQLTQARHSQQWFTPWKVQVHQPPLSQRLRHVISKTRRVFNQLEAMNLGLKT